MLSESQVSSIKRQLIEHIERTFPDEKKDSAIREIEIMEAEDLENFLIKNNLLEGQNKNQECIFCSIIFGDIPSYKIGENSEAVAVLEINPISKGHSLIIPKKHEENSDFSKNTEKLAKKISRSIKIKLKPKRIDFLTSSMFGHKIINLLPVYNDENFSSKRQPARKEDLDEVEKILNTTKKISIQNREPKKKLAKKENQEFAKKSSQNLWLPERIP